MRNFLSSLVTAITIVFSVPTFLILITWNSLPGDRLYPIKTSLEDVALFVTVNTPIGSAFSINFTERRFTEANRLLAKQGSSVGYNYLVNETRQSKEIIINNNDYKNAQALVKKIEDYQTAIEEKKQAIQISPSAVLPSITPGVARTALTPTVTPKATATPTLSPQGISPSLSPSPPPTATPTTLPPPELETPEEVIDNLEETQEELEEIKEEVKKRLPPQASDRAVEIHEDSRQDRGRGNDER